MTHHKLHSCSSSEQLEDIVSRIYYDLSSCKSIEGLIQKTFSNLTYTEIVELSFIIKDIIQNNLDKSTHIKQIVLAIEYINMKNNNCDINILEKNRGQIYPVCFSNNDGRICKSQMNGITQQDPNCKKMCQSVFSECGVSENDECNNFCYQGNTDIFSECINNSSIKNATIKNLSTNILVPLVTNMLNEINDVSSIENLLNKYFVSLKSYVDILAYKIKEILKSGNSKNLIVQQIVLEIENVMMNNIKGTETKEFYVPGNVIPTPIFNNAVLYGGVVMNSGNYLKSSNGNYTAVMQGDGNFVIYNPSGAAVWALQTVKVNNYIAGSSAVMQNDGNFVIYSPSGNALWATGTMIPGSIAVMQNDGNFVIYSPSGLSLWSTQTGVQPYITSPPSEVYQLSVGAGWPYTNTYANQAAGLTAANNLNLNAVVATNDQITTAQQNQANWCSAGWDSDGQIVYPISVLQDGCGTTTGVQNWGSSGGPYAVNLYGVKPPSNFLPNCNKLSSTDQTTTCLRPFNSFKWSQYS